MYAGDNGRVYGQVAEVLHPDTELEMAPHAAGQTEDELLNPEASGENEP